LIVGTGCVYSEKAQSPPLNEPETHFQFVYQYGDVFTFILLGRRVTVALGPKGNHFILNGKGIVFNAEDAYTVCPLPPQLQILVRIVAQLVVLVPHI